MAIRINVSQSGGVRAFNNLERFDGREPGYSIYCGILKIRWANYILRDLRKHMPIAENRMGHLMRQHYDYVNNVTTLQFYAMKFGPWFSYTMPADIISNLRNSFDYAWSGLVRSSPSEKVAARAKHPPDMPYKPTLDEVEAHVRASLSPEIADRAVEYYRGYLKPLQAESDDGNSLFRSLNNQARWVRHNQLPQMVCGVHVDKLEITSATGRKLAFKQKSVAPGGVITERFPGLVRNNINLDQVYVETELAEPQSDYGDRNELFARLESYSDLAKDAMLRFIDAFPETVWFRDNLDEIFGRPYTDPHQPIAG